MRSPGFDEIHLPSRGLHHAADDAEHTGTETASVPHHPHQGGGERAGIDRQDGRPVAVPQATVASERSPRCRGRSRHRRTRRAGRRLPAARQRFRDGPAAAAGVVQVERRRGATMRPRPIHSATCETVTGQCGSCATWSRPAEHRRRSGCRRAWCGRTPGTPARSAPGAAGRPAGRRSRPGSARAACCRCAARAGPVRRRASRWRRPAARRSRRR